MQLTPVIILLMLLNSLLFLVKTEMYSAVVNLIPLIKTQDMVIRSLKQYIKEKETVRDILEKHLKIYEMEHSKASDNPTGYLGNPINAYRLIKRLTTDLDYLEHLIGDRAFTKNRSCQYPKESDLEGAAVAIIRLHSTYRLNVTQLSNGIISSTSSSSGDLVEIIVSPMTVCDCFKLAVQCYENERYQLSIALLVEALYKYEYQDTRTYNISATDIFGYLQNSYSMLDDLRASTELYEMILSPRPEKYKWMVNKYRANINSEIVKIHNREDDKIKSIKKLSAPRLYLNDLEIKMLFEHICRGDYKISAEETKRLKCYYAFGPHASLLIAPIKIEQLHRHPEMSLFHDIAHEDETRQLLEYSVPILFRATIIDSKQYYFAISGVRVSKYAEVLDKDNEVARKLSNRVSAVTGLAMDTAEGLQTINYGIGGHFMPHNDYFPKVINYRTGNRIATALFYFTDVPLGGATVFTELGLRVHPKKGTALFWNNLHSSGEGDYFTKHGGCPVLAGNKWIGNKWIHEIGQELLKPCYLKK